VVTADRSSCAQAVPVIVNTRSSRRTTRPPNPRTSEPRRAIEKSSPIFSSSGRSRAVVSLTIFVLGLRSIGLLPVLRTRARRTRS